MNNRKTHRTLAAILATFALVTPNLIWAQQPPEAREQATDGDARNAIEQVLRQQQDAWNRADIDRFMQFYWQSPELTFSSGGQTTRGWQATLQRYRDRYTSAKEMGQLTFSQLECFSLGPNAAYVLGRWDLEREAPIGGNFSLVVRRIDGDWKIVHDHTSVLDD